MVGGFVVVIGVVVAAVVIVVVVYVAAGSDGCEKRGAGCSSVSNPPRLIAAVAVVEWFRRWRAAVRW